MDIEIYASKIKGIGRMGAVHPPSDEWHFTFREGASRYDLRGLDIGYSSKEFLERVLADCGDGKMFYKYEARKLWAEIGDNLQKW